MPTPTSPATSGNPMSRRSPPPPPSVARRRKPRSPPSREPIRAGVARPPPGCAVAPSAVHDKGGPDRPPPALPEGSARRPRKTNRSGDNKSSPCARVRNVGRATSSNIPEIRGDPICRDRPLGLSQRHTPRADKLVEHKFQLVLPVRSPTVGRCPRLGPRVPRIGRSASQLQRDQVILLVVAQPPVVIAERRDLLALQLLRISERRAHHVRPPADTDRLADGLLRNRRVDRPRRRRRVWPR